MDTFNTLTPGSVIFILLGVTFLGGAVGSFLNVVIYRLPAGLSLIHPPSRCPRCEHSIRAYDNIPVFGWLLLRGKCRDCGQPISPRYPVIEAIVALTFLLIAWLEWFGPRCGLVFPGYVSSVEAVVTRAGLHALLLTTLLGAGMIEWDQLRQGGKTAMPGQIWLPLIFACIMAWAFLPSLVVMPGWQDTMPIMGSLLDGLFGAAGGSLVGMFLWWIESSLSRFSPTNADATRDVHTITLLFLCIGMVLGWQMAALIGVFYLPFLCTGVQLRSKAEAMKSLLPHGLFLFALTLAGIVAFCFIPFYSAGQGLP